MLFSQHLLREEWTDIDAEIVRKPPEVPVAISLPRHHAAVQMSRSSTPHLMAKSAATIYLIYVTTGRATEATIRQFHRLVKAMINIGLAPFQHLIAGSVRTMHTSHSVLSRLLEKVQQAVRGPFRCQKLVSN